MERDGDTPKNEEDRKKWWRWRGWMTDEMGERKKERVVRMKRRKWTGVKGLRSFSRKNSGLSCHSVTYSWYSSPSSFLVILGTLYLVLVYNKYTCPLNEQPALYVYFLSVCIRKGESTISWQESVNRGMLRGNCRTLCSLSPFLHFDPFWRGDRIFKLESKVWWCPSSTTGPKLTCLRW